MGLPPVGAGVVPDPIGPRGRSSNGSTPLSGVLPYMVPIEAPLF